ncbi:major capsid protein [Orrella sp. JC864]|uniref:major capsid protein n=1 Tax=Orrella sp. JC864 TaxID=3120298 RepID=UPI00300A62E6
MTTTVNSDLIIYNDLAQTAYLERIQDNLDVFNAASAGAIVLRNELIEGDFQKRTFYRIGGTLEHRNVNSTDKPEGKAISHLERVGVKVPWKYGPYQSTEEAFKRRARTPEEFSMIVGQDLADATIEGFIRYSVNSLVAAIGANAGTVVTGSIAVDGKKTLTRGLRRFGDRFSRIALWVMDSASYFDIVDEAIANKLYGEADVVVYGGLPGTLGRPVLVTDQMPANRILALQPGASEVVESQAPGFRSYPINDQENLAIGIRAEGTVNLNLLGYSWKEDTGGANPTMSALGSGANWHKHAASDKSTAGVLINLTGDAGAGS